MNSKSVTRIAHYRKDGERYRLEGMGERIKNNNSIKGEIYELSLQQVCCFIFAGFSSSSAHRDGLEYILNRSIVITNDISVDVCFIASWF